MRLFRLLLALVALCALIVNAQACLWLGVHLQAATCCSGTDNGHGDQEDDDAAGECAVCSFALPTAPAPASAPLPPVPGPLSDAAAFLDVLSRQSRAAALASPSTEPPPDPVVVQRVRFSAPRALPARGPDFRA